MLSSVVKLTNWYRSQPLASGSSPGGSRVRIETLDNPGWLIKIQLAGTGLEKRPFAAVGIERAEDDWISCAVKDSVFTAAGGPNNLEELLTTFFQFAEIPE